jgi:hypothetical protein
VNRGSTFEIYTNDYNEIKEKIKELSKEVSEALKYRGLISNKILFGYKSSITDLGPRVAAKTFSATLEYATNDFETIFSKALSLYEKHIEKEESLKYVGVSASNLIDEFYKVEQLTVWNFDDPREELSNSKQLIKELNSIVGYQAFTDGNAIGAYKRYIDKSLINSDKIKFKR